MNVFITVTSVLDGKTVARVSAHSGDACNQDHSTGITREFRFEQEYEIDFENESSIPVCKHYIITSSHSHLITGVIRLHLKPT